MNHIPKVGHIQSNLKGAFLWLNILKNLNLFIHILVSFEIFIHFNTTFIALSPFLPHYLYKSLSSFCQIFLEKIFSQI